ncbi:hypothetical protein CASFOL_006263 [Castilleja foliolosa]|uniref:Uncharacterized protein n=1 Tax=Castilleja foliolosa TaxID=1961234 RepID=A0ABD3E5W0_9LAMI
MGPINFPLRWESTGDKWWFASPIDWAAANGHYDLVRQLLHIDPNLLINLTSLPRIRRLETVWDDDDSDSFSDVAKCRSQVAHKLLQECETKTGHNSLIGAGYGGWLLYTAASAGDSGFVRELLDRDPLLVFGEGEYGVTDMLYAAARSKRGDVFGMLFDCCVSPRGMMMEAAVSGVFQSEMMSRAVHAAARGGSVEVLRSLLGDGDVLGCRDGMGSTVLHTASGKGQVEVVKHLISSYEIINSTDNRGNTALHIAAYCGQLPVVELLVSASPSTASLTNNYGDTFLHMAISGFRAPSFRRINRQTELIKQIVRGNTINMQDIINMKNNDGRTALHVAVIENIQSDIVELLMSVRSVDLNIRYADGHTPLNLLKQRPRSSSSETLIKRLISAGGISDCPRNALVTHLRMRGIGGSPGTSFRVPDAEILLYAGIGDMGSEYGYSGEIKKFGSVNMRLKNFLRLPRKKERDIDVSDLDDNYSSDFRLGSLRQQFSSNILPSPSTKKKFAVGLTKGVLRVGQRSYFGSPSSAYSESSWSSPVSADGRKGVARHGGEAKMKGKNGSLNLRLMNRYLCFGAQSLDVEKSVHSLRESQKRQGLVV